MFINFYRNSLYKQIVYYLNIFDFLSKSKAISLKFVSVLTFIVNFKYLSNVILSFFLVNK